jgi:hypothetical protein
MCIHWTTVSCIYEHCTTMASMLPDLLDGLLLPSVVGGSPACLQEQGGPGIQHFNVATNLEGGHVFLQWQTFLSAHHHNAEQVRETVSRRTGALLITVAQLVEALRYKTECRRFDSRWCHWNFSLTESFRPHYGPRVDSASNRNEYQEYILGVMGAGE